MQNDQAKGKKESRNMLDKAKIGRGTPKGSRLLGVFGLSWTGCAVWGGSRIIKGFALLGML